PPAPAYAAPAPVYPQQTKKPSGDKTLGVGAFFGLMLLFAIPVLGWIACLVFALVPANKNCKNFARAYLIIILIGIGALVGLYFLLTWLWGLVVDAIINFVSDVTGGLFNELDELRNIFDLFKNLDISGGGLDGLFGSDGLGGLDGLLSSLPSIPG
ncbi:MAG: hypothetical protein LBI44_02500, partial [Oscillospiraceae bacterium]|nr:hypothetical protein [Oscillospiraceae bacterium]